MSRGFTCLNCGKDLGWKRRHAKTCGPACRQALYRAMNRPEVKKALRDARAGQWAIEALRLHDRGSVTLPRPTSPSGKAVSHE